LMGSLMAVAMIVYSGRMYWHLGMMHTIGSEVLTIRNPVVLAERAAERKPSMLLLPYGIPIAAGSIVYFALAGFLT
jgi:prepilin peptidase CpaA